MIQYLRWLTVNYDKSYIDNVYDPNDLNEKFIHDFIRFRKENNLTQDLFSKFSGVPREKIARIESGMHSPSVYSLLQILAPIGYTIKIVKYENKKYYEK